MGGNKKYFKYDLCRVTEISKTVMSFEESLYQVWIINESIIIKV